MTFLSPQWSRELGKRTLPHRVNIPVHACEHYYLVTKPIAGTSPLMPVIRDYDGYVYFREWNGGLLGGGFEPNPKPCFHHGPPDKFEFQLLQEDWDHFRKLSVEVGTCLMFSALGCYFPLPVCGCLCLHVCAWNSFVDKSLHCTNTLITINVVYQTFGVFTSAKRIFFL